MVSFCYIYLLTGKGEVIGEEGDFITAPEISQLFGEMVGVWCLSMYQQMGSPQKIYLVELGPGKGTLMKDIMRIAGKFPAFKDAVSVHMVELSSVLRNRQHDALGCSGPPKLTSSPSPSAPSGGTSTAYSSPSVVDAKNSEQNTSTSSGQDSSARRIKDGEVYTMSNGVTVSWQSFLQQVPTDAPALIIGKEPLFPSHMGICV